jgi:hypothetical protein
MLNLNELVKGGTLCLGCAGLAVDASAKADAETLANFAYAINGLTYTLTSDDGDVQLDGNTVAAGFTALFLACVNAAGAITVVKSAEVANTALTAGTQVLQWPTPTVNTCPIGALKVANASAAVFTGGTTLLDAADITTTYYNLFAVPTGPLTS